MSGPDAIVTVTRVLGHRDDPEFAGRGRDGLAVAWDEASKPRLRRTSALGRDVLVDVGRGHYLADGDVLADDGSTVLVVERPAERALVVRLDPGCPLEQVVHDAVRIGHAFGNQHVPIEPDGTTVLVPLTTSEDVARRTVESLGLSTARVTVAEARLGRSAPLRHGHRHPPS